MTAIPDTAATRRQIGDETLYFCSTHCATAFDADPARYTPSRKPFP